MYEQRIHDLSCFVEPVRIEPLAGGITNRNYLVHDSAGSYVARVCQPGELLGIDRRNEILCHEAAAACGVAPRIVEAAHEIIVTPFITGHSLSAEDVRDVQMIDRVAERFRTLHNALESLSGEMIYFSPFQTVRTYVKRAHYLGAELPRDIERLVDDANGLSRRLRPFHPTLCHNDLLPANLIDDGSKLWLVDWEYGGIGHPLFDLAGVAGNCGLDETQERQLLASYRGEFDERDLQELHILKTASLLREALWAVIQTVCSEIEFDYVAYSRDNFAAYERARAELDRTVRKTF